MRMIYALIVGAVVAGCSSHLQTLPPVEADRLARDVASTQAAPRWTLRAPLPAPRFADASAAVNRTLYVAGGLQTTPSCSWSNTLFAYDVPSDSWSTKAPMPTARAYVMGAGANGMFYAIGGQTSCGAPPLSTVEAYNPKTNAWTVKRPMPAGVLSGGTAVVRGIVYVIGGAGALPGGGYAAWSRVFAYDPKTDTWTEKAPMPTPRVNLGATALNGIIYAVGGRNAGALAVNEAFNPVTNTWAPGASLAKVRQSFAIGSLAGRVIVAGGIDDVGTIATAEAYSPQRNAWLPLPSMPVPTSDTGNGNAVASGAFHAVGGYNPTSGPLTQNQVL